MKFIHVADIHLGMVPDKKRAWSQERSREVYESFYRVLDRCNKEKIDFLLIAGDLFHQQPLLRELKEVNYHFSKLLRTKVVMMAGNHDYMGKHSRYCNFSWCDQVYFLSSQEIEEVYFPEHETTVYGLSYHQRDIFEGKYDMVLPSNRKGFHILLAHGGDTRNIPINKNRISSAGFDYVALGHIHKHEFLSETIAYAGSLEPLDKSECGEHGFILGELSELRRTFQFIPCSKRQYFHLPIEVEPHMVKGEVLDYVKNRISQLGRQHIYKIILSGVKEPEITFLEDDFNGFGNIVEVEDYTIPDYDFELLQYQNRNNIIGMFIQAIRQSGEKDEIADKALYYGMEALLKKQ